MNKVLSLTLMATLLAPTTAFAQSVSEPGAQPLVEQVVEKQLLGQLYPGHRPMISVYQQPTGQFMPVQPAGGRVEFVKQPVATNAVTKTYTVAPGVYQSQIAVQDQKGQTLTHINVGRRISRMVASPANNRLYVLCGGYFGSVWEIDTTRDVVVRKLPTFNPGVSDTPVWNPTDISLSQNGRYLAMGSGKVQVMDTVTGHLAHEFMLPDDALAVTHISPAAADSFRFRVQMKDGGTRGYQLVDEQLQPSAPAGANPYHPHKIKITTQKFVAPAASRQMFMASRNTDFIRMVDKVDLLSTGLLPVDFPVDDIEISPDRKKLFAYHRRYGQVSIIDLNPRSPYQYSTVKRIRDPRFKDNLQLASAVDSVYLWNGSGKILAGFHQETLYPRIGIPFSVRLMPEAESKVWVSRPAHQRYYVREGKLYSEYLEKGPSRPSDRVNIGAGVRDIKMSPDKRELYVLTEQAELLRLDTRTREVKQRLALKQMNPGTLAISADGNTLVVTDRNTGLLRKVHTPSFATRNIMMDMDAPLSYHITLFDPRLTQVIEVELPRFSEDVVRVRS